jgi:hypothetical protein
MPLPRWLARFNLHVTNRILGPHFSTRVRTADSGWLTSKTEGTELRLIGRPLSPESGNSLSLCMASEPSIIAPDIIRKSDTFD